MAILLGTAAATAAANAPFHLIASLTHVMCPLSAATFLDRLREEQPYSSTWSSASPKPRCNSSSTRHDRVQAKLTRVCQPRSCSLICTLSVRLLKNIVVCRLLLFVVVRGTLGWLLVIVIGCSRVISREYDYSRLLDIVIYRWRSFVHPSHSSQPLLSLSRLYLPQCACNTRACKLAVLYY